MSLWDAQEDDKSVYRVVVNQEEQYSIWPQGRELPSGWVEVGVTGSRAQCLDHIESVWTDMRPLSLRKFLESVQDAPSDNEEAGDPAGDDLLQRLAVDQELRLGVSPGDGLQELQDAIDRRYIHVRFTSTETVLGLDLLEAEWRVDGGDLSKGSGTLLFAGSLELNFQRVKLVGQASLETMAGTGRLEGSR